MKLQTEIPLEKAKNPIGYGSHMLLLGSCFAENMGRKFDYFKFRELQNPLGILFHPLAIGNLIGKAIRRASYSESDIFFLNERWHCFDAHSSLSDTSKENLLNKLNAALDATRSQLEKASHIIITLGTAWAYRHIESEAIVANCHKVPQKKFSKQLLSVEVITNSLKRTIDHVRSINKNVQFIFTVSPVRHLKDGFVENQWSKAHLISSVHNVLKASGVQNAKINGKVGPALEDYFPSYEIMMDELRDYRFYETDMVHPSPLAIDYIWEKFKQVWISEKAYATMENVDTIQKGLQHRPFNPDSEQHLKFIETLKSKMALIRQEYPFMRF